MRYVSLAFRTLSLLDLMSSSGISKRKAVRRPWVTTSILDPCDERRALKKGRHETEEGVRKYRAVNQEIKKNIGLMYSVKILQIISGRTMARKHIS